MPQNKYQDYGLQRLMFDMATYVPKMCEKDIHFKYVTSDGGYFQMKQGGVFKDMRQFQWTSSSSTPSKHLPEPHGSYATVYGNGRNLSNFHLATNRFIHNGSANLLRPSSYYVAFQGYGFEIPRTSSGGDIRIPKEEVSKYSRVCICNDEVSNTSFREFRAIIPLTPQYVSGNVENTPAKPSFSNLVIELPTGVSFPNIDSIEVVMCKHVTKLSYSTETTISYEWKEGNTSFTAQMPVSWRNLTVVNGEVTSASSTHFWWGGRGNYKSRTVSGWFSDDHYYRNERIWRKFEVNSFENAQVKVFNIRFNSGTITCSIDGNIWGSTEPFAQGVVLWVDVVINGQIQSGLITNSGLRRTPRAITATRANLNATTHRLTWTY